MSDEAEANGKHHVHPGLYQPCALCGQRILSTSEIVVLRRVADGAKGPQETDPTVGYVHGVCQMQRAVDELRQQLVQANVTVASMIAASGGMIRVHREDVVKSAQVNHEFTVEDFGGYWAFTLRKIASPPGGLVNSDGRPLGG